MASNPADRPPGDDTGRGKKIFAFIRNVVAIKKFVLWAGSPGAMMRAEARP